MKRQVSGEKKDTWSFQADCLVLRSLRPLRLRFLPLAILRRTVDVENVCLQHLAVRSRLVFFDLARHLYRYARCWCVGLLTDGAREQS